MKLDIVSRNQQICRLFISGRYRRKQIAIRLCTSYDTVKKVLQQFSRHQRIDEPRRKPREVFVSLI